LGNSRAKAREENMEENNIPFISNKLGYFCVTRYSYHTRKLPLDKYAIQVGKIGDLLSLMGKQDYKAGSPGD
jgi:hypothetical protein